MRSARLVCLIIGGTLMAAPVAARCGTGESRQAELASSTAAMSGEAPCADSDEAASPAIFVLAPKAGGLTMSASPTLYWFMPQRVRGKIELAVTADEADEPVFDQLIDAPARPGIYAISLAERQVKLKLGVAYAWSVTLSVDPLRPERDVVASGRIVPSAPSPELTRRLLATPERKWPAILAEAGLWYDAFAALSRQAAAEPGTRAHRESRAALLEQAGLEAAAAFERAHP